MVGEMSIRGNVLVGKCPVGKVSFGEVSGRGIARLGKCQSGICPRESVSRGSVRSGNCPAIALPLYQFSCFWHIPIQRYELRAKISPQAYTDPKEPGRHRLKLFSNQ